MQQSQLVEKMQEILEKKGRSLPTIEALISMVTYLGYQFAYNESLNAIPGNEFAILFFRKPGVGIAVCRSTDNEITFSSDKYDERLGIKSIEARIVDKTPEGETLNLPKFNSKVISSDDKTITVDGSLTQEAVLLFASLKISEPGKPFMESIVTNNEGFISLSSFLIPNVVTELEQVAAIVIKNGKTFK